MNKEIIEARKQDALDRIHNEAIDDEIQNLQDDIQRLQLKKKGDGLFYEKRKVISSSNVYSFVNKPVKFLLSRLNRNTKLLDKRNDSSVLNEQILITSALTLKAQKSSKHLYEIEAFTNDDLLLEHAELIL